MQIKSAEFIMSNSEVAKCPKDTLPEYAFIGRSNVGKSSLINMLTNHKNLAKTSGRPGKTQLINHFLINKTWFLVDLPGYGYAKVSKSSWGLAFAKSSFQSCNSSILEFRVFLMIGQSLFKSDLKAFGSSISSNSSIFSSLKKSL